MTERRGAAFALAREFKKTHDNVLESVAVVGDEQFAWRPPRSNSIAFNLWHIARWSDHLRSILSAMTPALRERIGASEEVWISERMAGRWNIPAGDLGARETGMGMDEDRSAALLLPPKDELLAYARRVFALSDDAISLVRDEDLADESEIAPERVPWLAGPPYGTVATWLVVSLRHEARHLGMIEALKGVAGMRGSATV